MSIPQPIEDMKAKFTGQRLQFVGMFGNANEPNRHSWRHAARLGLCRGQRSGAASRAVARCPSFRGGPQALRKIRHRFAVQGERLLQLAGAALVPSVDWPHFPVSQPSC